MADSQAWLLPFANPLCRTVPAAFFKVLPRSPGIYRMLDDAGTVLYVGKAKDLRARVGSYRFAAPGRAARKTLRLLARVRTIDWKCCADEQEALLLENRLLRDLQPPFNVQKTRPRMYRYVTLVANETGDALHCRFPNRFAAQGDDEAIPPGAFGAFKGVEGLREWARCLERLSALAAGDPLRARNARRTLADEAVLRFPPLAAVVWRREVERYLRGASDRLVDVLADLARRREVAGFQAQVVARDAEFLRDYFQRTSHRAHRIRRRSGLPRAPIPAEVLDDLLVLAVRQTGPTLSTRRMRV